MSKRYTLQYRKSRWMIHDGDTPMPMVDVDARLNLLDADNLKLHAKLDRVESERNALQRKADMLDESVGHLQACIVGGRDEKERAKCKAINFLSRIAAKEGDHE